MVYQLKYLLEEFQLFISDLINMFLSLIKIVVLSKFNAKIPSIGKKEVIVIGNGPSFKKALIEFPAFFQGKDLICVNNFPATEEYEILKPSSLVLLDNNYYPRKGVVILPIVEKLFESIVNKTTWELKIFLPQISRSSKQLKELAIKNSNVKIFYFNYTIVNGFDWFNYFFYKKNIGMPLCQNVIVASIFLSINMNYKNVYLIGVENSFFKNIVINNENEVYLQHSHFYNEDKTLNVSKVHKVPGSSEKADIADVLTMFVKTFKGYKVVKKYGDYRRANIYNVTEDSYIDAFERKKITDLI
jgi:hypothetical protein